MYETADCQALLLAVLANPGEGTVRNALSDYLQEQGEVKEVTETVEPMQRVGTWDIYTFLVGSGMGSSRGSGMGSGSGKGMGMGSGRGLGSGRGGGSGMGRGSGSGGGSGMGRGLGSGSGRGSIYEERHMQAGKAYLMFCGDWHTFVGRVVRQVAPFTYEMESVSKVAETNNGDCWEKLADGDKRLRKACTYRHHKGLVIFPLTIAAVEWEGKTPQEEGL